jgi:hypothetical protein
LAIEDLVAFFRSDDKFFEKVIFRKLIKKYPKHIREHLGEYLILRELLKVSRGIGNWDLSRNRISNLVNFTKKNV